MSGEKKVLPVLRVQHDWFELVRSSGGGNVWLSCSCPGRETLHDKVQLRGNHQDNSIAAADHFLVNVVNKRALEVECREFGVTCYFIAPHSEFNNVHGKAVRWLDISPSGSLGVSCADDGKLQIWQSSNGTVRRELVGHLSDVTTCRFFPSGVVVLSGGRDMKLRIWSAEDGSCPVTMTGHKGGITDSAVIDRGRNIVSCSRDGSAKLWDCGTAACLDTVSSSDSCINSCCLRSAVCAEEGTSSASRSDRECGTDGKVLVLGREDGSLEGFALGARTKLFSLDCQSPVNSCCFVDEHSVLAGLEDGRILCSDIRKPGFPSMTLDCGTTPVTCVQRFDEKSTLASRYDGSCVCVRNDFSLSDKMIQLCGPNLDPVYRVAANGKCVYTASRDGKIRKYCIDSDA